MNRQAIEDLTRLGWTYANCEDAEYGSAEELLEEIDSARTNLRILPDEGMRICELILGRKSTGDWSGEELAQFEDVMGGELV